MRTAHHRRSGMPLNLSAACSIADNRDTLPREGERADHRDPAAQRVAQEREGPERNGASERLGLEIERGLIVGAEDHVPGGIEVQDSRPQLALAGLDLTVP